MIGQTISHYRIVEYVGEGAMGVVYKAEDTTLGRQVAIKFLSATTSEYRARFLREARAVSALSHPNIATVFDYGETQEGTPYIVMELVTGEPLSDKLREGALPLRSAVRIITSIAEALGEAHQQGVVHRDVKPSNVVISERGRTKVLDFGLVKHLEELNLKADPNQGTLPSARTRSDVIVGTPLYLSPEQATGRPVGPRSDLFALGSVLYECVTGRTAFDGSNLIEIGAQVLHATPVRPSKLNSQIPSELDRITMKALEKKVEDRYQSADELIADLNAILPTLSDERSQQGRVTETYPRPRTESASAIRTIADNVRRTRVPLPAILLGVLVAAAIGLGLYFWLKPGPYRPAPGALQLYNSGNEALRNGAFLQASKAFEQAIAQDPKFPLAHARLAEALYELDYQDRAEDAILKVQSLVPNRSRLAATDQLHLEGIMATVGQDPPAAIAAYKALIDVADDKSQAYLDLGRAYEKNEDTKNGIASYREATNLAPQYPTPFLRVGILYGRQLDLASANAAFDKADALYQATGNYEGQAEVSFQRGALFDQLSKIPEARQHLQRALELARTTGNDYQQVKTLQKLGDVELDAHNVAESRKYMLEALDLAKSKGIDNLYKRGLVDLGNTYLGSGDYQQAENYYKQSLDLSIQQKDPKNTARAHLSLAALYERRANPDEVLKYVEQALPFYQKGGYRKEMMQAVSLLARAKSHLGDYPAALDAFQRQLDLSQQYGDTAQAGLAHQSMGFIYMNKGEYPEALSRFQQYQEIAKSLGVAKNVVLSQVDCANAWWRMGRYDEARAALNDASSAAEEADAAKNFVAAYFLALSRVALTERDFPVAVTQSGKALELAEAAQLRRTLITSKAVNCLGQTLSGRWKLDRCSESVELARQLRDPSFISEALLMTAESQLQSGNGAEALKSALEARDLFARAGNIDGQWLASLIAARASEAAGDEASARRYATEAQELFGRLTNKWGADNFDRYSKRPDIQLYRSQLNQLLAQK